MASGHPARWNSKDVKVIYTAASRSLACLENVVHRSGLGLQSLFNTMVIDIPDLLPVSTIHETDLPADWKLFEHFPATQALGDDWISKGATAILQIPSAIVSAEFNYLLNPSHPDFKQIKLSSIEPFEFDPRIKN